LDLELVRTYNYMFNTCIVDELQDAATKPGVKAALTSAFCARFYVGLTAADKITGALRTLVRSYSYKDDFVFMQPPNFVVIPNFIAMSERTTREYNLLKEKVLSSEDGLRGHQLHENARALLSLEKVGHVAHILKSVPTRFKVIVVSEFSATLRNLSAMLPKFQHALLDTKIQKQENRRKLLQRFQECDTCSFLLASLDIIHLGVNLGFADYMIIMEPPFLQWKKKQLLGRLRRLGQRPKNVAVQEIMEIIVQNTCDAQLYQSNNCLGAIGHKQLLEEQEDDDAAPDEKEDA